MNSEIKIAIGDIFEFKYPLNSRVEFEIFYVCSIDVHLNYVHGTLINSRRKYVSQDFTWNRVSLEAMVISGSMIQHKRKPNEF